MKTGNVQTMEQVQAVLAAIKIMRESSDAIFYGRADQYHSDMLREAAKTLKERFGIVEENASRFRCAKEGHKFVPPSTLGADFHEFFDVSAECPDCGEPVEAVCAFCGLPPCSFEGDHSS